MRTFNNFFKNALLYKLLKTLRTQYKGAYINMWLEKKNNNMLLYKTYNFDAHLQTIESTTHVCQQYNSCTQIKYRA